MTYPTKRARIITKTVGQNFGVYAVVYDRKTKVHVTDTYSFGSGSAARLAAEDKARELGLAVTDADYYAHAARQARDAKDLTEMVSGWGCDARLRGDRISFADGSTLSVEVAS